jgi:hypothetical protein
MYIEAAYARLFNYSKDNLNGSGMPSFAQLLSPTARILSQTGCSRVFYIYKGHDFQPVVQLRRDMRQSAQGTEQQMCMPVSFHPVVV